jgi:hypothetical protein
MQEAVKVNDPTLAYVARDYSFTLQRAIEDLPGRVIVGTLNATAWQSRLLLNLSSRV